ncbi:MAG: hypothetical protein V4501_07310 [Pseudomonadota bacterium]
MLAYKVAAKYQKGPETVVAKFERLNEAQAFIQDKLREDIGLKVNVIYNLYELGELVASFDQSQLDSNQASDSSEGGGGQQKSSSQRFSPSPLQTNLRPTGMPPSSFVDDDDVKK